MSGNDDNKIVRRLPLLLLLVVIALAFFFNWHHFFSIETLQQNYPILQYWVKKYYIVTVLSWFLLYCSSVALSLPTAAWLTIIAGFLFGPILGSLYSIIAASVSATAAFMLVRFSFGNKLKRRAHGWVSMLEKGFKRDAFYYLLFLRLIPIFPFWVINIVPALLRMDIRQYMLATTIGVIPGSVVYVFVGNGLGDVLAHDQAPDLGVIFHPNILLPILALALLSLLPIIVKKIIGHYHD